MHLLIAGKSAFSRMINETPVPISIAGHTVQLIRPLASYALSRGAAVSYAYPLQASASDCLMFDPGDRVPEGLVEVPFTELSAAKSPLRIGWLSVEASVRQAIERQGGIDWVFLASTFPLAPVLAQAKEKYGYRLALFIRGHDGYKWLDPEAAASTFGDPDRTRHICHIYREALQSADLVGVASEWLGAVIARHGVRWDMVVESPAAMTPGPELPWDKARFAAESAVVTRCGTLDTAKKWLLSAGRIHPDKHLDLTADIVSAAALPDWQLVIAGIGAAPDDWLTGLIESGAACVIEVPPRNVHALFQVCDAYLQTSLPSDRFIDARPSSVTSAAFYGKPVVLPIASAGGVMESVAPENVETYGFDVRGLDTTDLAQRAEVLRRGTAAVLKLRDGDLVARAGAANAEHASGSSVQAVFDRVWDHLAHRS